MSSTRVALNSIILFGAEGIRRVIAFAMIFLIARALSVEDFGRVRLANSFLAIFLVLANFGINPMLVKRTAGGEGENGLMGRIQGVKIFLGLIAVAVSCLVVAVLDYQERTFVAIVLLAFAILPECLNDSNCSYFDGRQRMGLSAAVDLSRSLFLLGGVVVSLVLGWGMYGVVGAYLAHYIFGLVVSEGLLRRHFGARPPTFGLQGAWEVVREAWPYLLIGMVWIIAFRVDMIMLSKLQNEDSVGLYGSAYGLFEVLLILPALLARALFPALVDAEHDGSGGDTMRKSMRLFALIALPAGTAMALLSGRALEATFGANYVEAAGALTWLSSYLWLWFATMGLSWALTARGRLKTVLIANLTALVVNVGANLVLIPRMDYQGAALATVISEGAYLLVLIVPVHREIMKIDLKVIHPGSILSTLVMAAFLWHWASLALPILIPLGVLVFGVTAWLTGALREPFLRSMVRNLLSRRID